MASQIRKTILSLLLDLRADWSGRIGLDSSSYSSYLYSKNIFVPADLISDDIGQPGNDGRVLDITKILKVVNTCLQKVVLMSVEHGADDSSPSLMIVLLQEVDWNVLVVVLSKMPSQWQNKTLILSADQCAVDNICQTLCNMVCPSVYLSLFVCVSAEPLVVFSPSLQIEETGLRKLVNLPTGNFKKSDFDERIFPVLTCMTAYSTCLVSTQVRVIDI